MGDSFVDPELDLESALDCIRDTLQAKRMQADAVLFHVSCFPPAGFPCRIRGLEGAWFRSLVSEIVRKWVVPSPVRRPSPVTGCVSQDPT